MLNSLKAFIFNRDLVYSLLCGSDRRCEGNIEHDSKPYTCDSSESVTDDVTRFWREEREEGAVYNAYLKKVTYHTLSIADNEQGREFSHLMWETQKTRVIKAGTLEKLVESLVTVKGELDSTYVNVFLATYRTFATPRQVLDQLIQRYKWLKLSGQECTERKELQEIQQRTVKSVISVWLDTYSEDFREEPDYPCLHTLELFSTQYIPDSDLAMRARHKIDRFHKEALSRSDAGIEFRFSLCDEVDHMMDTEYLKPLQFMDIPNQRLAEQLTWKDAELFKRVVPHHCLGAVWARRARRLGKGGNVAGSVLATIEQFNRVSLRVSATILKSRDMKSSQRSRIVQKWIDIAQELRHLKNFSSLKAIISGLQAQAVYRLRRTWSSLPKESIALFQELADIFSNENNQIASRELLMKEATAKFPDVDSNNKSLRRRNMAKRQSWIENGIVQGTGPYLGTFLTDLTMIDTAIQDCTDDGLINFDKRRKEFEVLAQIKLLQSAAQIYSLYEDPGVWLWFDSVRVYDESESHDLSCAIEPMKDDSAKIKKKSSSLGHKPAKFDSSRFAMFACGLDDRSSVCSSSNLDSPVSPTPGMSHSSSTSSLLSYDSDPMSPFKSSDHCVVRVSFESGADAQTHVYKSIMLHNADHTNNVIDKVLEKYSVSGRHKDYCLLQVLPDGEMLIPDKVNVFYAMNNSGSELSFIVRSREEQDARNHHRRRGRRRLKKLSL
ncbi:ral guanine nucleotide dissociation stimulator-like 1 [Mizuhopecten yessoensis]|uniref:ral guanine nucleotide dissociation stimulator-like 1 n=1 Tax=Mizuhopecten yessoensis TaxID=6573 RepID=UPI000B45E717|nr:ral guanine nucleotide dissociation stimulator-like 1 [Mizuhopecten yessoensis]